MAAGNDKYPVGYVPWRGDDPGRRRGTSPGKPYHEDRAKRGTTDTIRRLIDSLYDVALIQSPESFALVLPAQPVPITPGATTATKLVQNPTAVPIMCHIRVQMLETDTTVYLYLGVDDVNTVAGRSPIMKQGAAPEAKVILPANMTLYGAMTAQDGNTNARNIIVASLPFRGRGNVFAEGS